MLIKHYTDWKDPGETPGAGCSRMLIRKILTNIVDAFIFFLPDKRVIFKLLKRRSI